MSSILSTTAQFIGFEPAVGHILHYWPEQYEKQHDHDQPFHSHICHVNDNGTVNLIIHNEIGIALRRINVTLAQGRAAAQGECSFPKG